MTQNQNPKPSAFAHRKALLESDLNYLFDALDMDDCAQVKAVCKCMISVLREISAGCDE